jgi:hypothetical protein
MEIIPFEHFSEIRADEPNYEQSAERFAALERALDEAQSLDEKLATLREWDDLQRQQGTWCTCIFTRTPPARTTSRRARSGTGSSRA